MRRVSFSSVGVMCFCLSIYLSVYLLFVCVVTITY